jgi:predicted Zn-dependent protease
MVTGLDEERSVLAGLLAEEVRLREQDVLVLRQAVERLVGVRRFAEAEFLLQLLVASRPENAYFQRAIGICNQYLNRHKRAVEAFDRALQLDPRDPFARVGRAAMRLRAADRSGAAEDLRHVERVTDNAPESLRRRIRILQHAVSVQPTATE